MPKIRDLFLITTARPSGLIQRMDKSGIDRSVVLNIATNANQEPSVNRFAVSLLENDRLIPFGSVFPGSDTWEQTLGFLAENGIRGIKLHPEYQNFDLDCDEAFKGLRKMRQARTSRLVPFQDTTSPLPHPSTPVPTALTASARFFRRPPLSPLTSAVTTCGRKRRKS